MKNESIEEGINRITRLLTEKGYINTPDSIDALQFKESLESYVNLLLKRPEAELSEFLIEQKKSKPPHRNFGEESADFYFYYDTGQRSRGITVLQVAVSINQHLSIIILLDSENNLPSARQVFDLVKEKMNSDLASEKTEDGRQKQNIPLMRRMRGKPKNRPGKIYYTDHLFSYSGRRKIKQDNYP